MDEVQFYLDQLESEDFPTRRQAAQMLGEYGDIRGVRPLMGILGDDSWQVRNTVIGSLIKIRDKNSIQPLVECLRDEDPAVRNSAMSVLNEIDEDVAQPLGVLLLNEKNEDVRIFSANTLGHIGGGAVVDLLVKGLADSDSNVRYACAEALGRTKSSSAVMPLIGTMKKEELWSRFPFMDALGLIGDERACPVLIESLKDDILCYPAMKALGLIGDISGLHPILDLLDECDDPTLLKASVVSIANIESQTGELAKVERQGYFYVRVLEIFKELDLSKLVDTSIEMLKSKETDEVEMGIKLLGYLKCDIPLEKIIPMLTDERIEDEIRDLIIRQGAEGLPAIIANLGSSEREIQGNLIRAVGVLGSLKDVDVLLPFLDSPVTEIVCDTLKALGMLNAVDCFERMAGFLGSTEDGIRNAAVGGITLLTKNDLAERLKDLTRSKNEHMRRGAYRIIGFVTSGELVDVLIEGISDESALVRAAVVQSLGYVGITNKKIMDNEEYFYSICSLLQDEEINVRVETIIALSRMNSSKSYGHLIRMLDSYESEVKRFAIRAVGKCRITDAVPRLCEILKEDDNTENRLFACIALGLCGRKEALPVLLDSLDDHALEVVEEAINAIGMIGDETVVDDILPYIEVESWIVRTAVLHAIVNLGADSAMPMVLGLIEDIKDGPSEEILLRYSLRVLGKIGGPEQSKLVVSFLSNTTTRYEAFETLCSIWYRHDVSYDIAGISDPLARRLACSVLGYLLKDSTVSNIEPCLNDPYPSVRRTVALVLSSMETEESEAVLKKMAQKDIDYWVKKIGNQRGRS